MKTRKLSKSRIFCVIVSVALAAVLAFYVLPLLNVQKHATRMVVKVNQSVPAGTKITESMVTKKEVGAYGLDKSVITKQADVIGKVSRRDLAQRDLIYPDDLCRPSEYQKKAGVNERLLQEGSVLVSVTTKTPAAAVAGQIHSGDVVDVCVAHKNQVTDAIGNSRTSISAAFPPTLCNMVVYSVQDSNMNSTAAKSADTGAAIPAVVTLVATPAQAVELAKYEYSDADSIHLVFDINQVAQGGGNAK